MDAPSIVGVHHVTIPVSSIAESCDWYTAALGFTLVIEMESEDAVVGAVLTLPCGVEVVLKLDPVRAQALAGFDALTLTVRDRAALEGEVTRCCGSGIRVSAPFPAHIGWAACLTDPDGLVVRLHTPEPFDQAGAGDWDQGPCGQVTSDPEPVAACNRTMQA